MALELPTTGDPPIAIRGLEHAPGGYLHGLSQPFLQARLSFSLPPNMDWTALDEAVRSAASEWRAPDATPSAEPLAGATQRILHGCGELQRSAGDAVFEPGRVLWRASNAAELTVIALPTADANVATAALKAMVAMINAAAGGEGAAAALRTAARVHLDELAELRRGSALSPTTRLFLEAAHQRRIPWMRLGAGNVFQLGHGVRQRWIRDAFTDQTSNLGSQLARNKAATASILRRLGFPTPEHIMVLDEDAAVRAAVELGYPVVVKPVDLDMGLAVAVRLTKPAEVRKAFVEARKLVRRVLVERFIEGRDFRLTVFNGRMVGAVERVAGAVTGDGRSTVRQLIDALNADPERGGRVAATLKKLMFDEEALEHLTAAGMSGESVPAQGQYVRLRGAANLARGGSRIDVMGQVHPDNQLLAERAADALKLDIAGVDLLSLDISRSWRETGTRMTEVNCQPDLLATIPTPVYGQILEGMVQGDGRIPIGLMVGAPAAATQLCARLLADAAVTVGVAGPGGVSTRGQSIPSTSADVFTGASVLLADAAIGAAVVVVSDHTVSRTGLPFDRCHAMALASSHLPDAAPSGPSFASLVRPLLPMCGASLIVNAEDEGCWALAAQAPGARLVVYAANAECKALRQHRSGGGASLWIEKASGAAEVVIATGAGAPMRLPLSGQSEGSAAGDILLAVAVAGALGRREAHLRRALADVQLSA
jgi:cyanophycin synthetase